MSDDPCNLLVIMTDRHRADCIRCYGNEFIRTPNLDSLAAEGVRFTSAFTANPFCMPSRFTLQTGRYPHAHGCRDNGVLMADDTAKAIRPSITSSHGGALRNRYSTKPHIA